MKFMNGILSIDDVKLLTLEQVEDFNKRSLWGDPVPGEIYYDFESKEVHTLISFEDDKGDFGLFYEGGKANDPDRCFPLMTIGDLMDTLSFEDNLEIRSWGEGWLVIFRGTIFETEERDGLPRLLFDVLRHKLNKF